MGGGLADPSQWTLYYTYTVLDQVPEAKGKIFDLAISKTFNDCCKLYFDNAGLN